MICTTNHHSNESRRRAAGQSLAELGVLTPVLVIMLVGIVDFGRVLMARHIITNAAREGVRVAVVSEDDAYTKTDETVKQYLSGGGLDLDRINVVIEGANAPTGQSTTISISYQLDSLALAMVHANSTITLSTASTMPHE